MTPLQTLFLDSEAGHILHYNPESSGGISLYHYEGFSHAFTTFYFQK